MADNRQAGNPELPREVRELIWSQLLDVGTIVIDDDLATGGIVPRWPVDGMNEAKKPVVAILRLSWTFLAETEPILYKRNTYILRSETSIEGFLRILHTSREDRRPWLHKIQIGLGYHDMCHIKDACIQVESDIAMFESNLQPDGDDQNFERNQPYEFWSHRLRKARKRHHTWPRKLRQVSDELNPQHLTLDLRQAYCELAQCCSMQATALMQLKEVEFDQGVPELHVLGLWGFTDSMPLTMGDRLMRSLWKSWNEPGTMDDQCSEAEKHLKNEMEEEMKNNGRWAR